MIEINYSLIYKLMPERVVEGDKYYKVVYNQNVINQ
jgi:hypothetical protein